MSDPVLMAYGEARRNQLTLRREFAPFRCEFAEPEEVQRCYLAGGDTSEWCESCRQREPIYQQWKLLHAAEKKALRKLQRLALAMLKKDPT